MPGKPDLGGYIDKLTRRRSGGRHHDDEHDREDDQEVRTDDTVGPPEPSTRSRRSVLKDAVGRGASSARRTADRVISTARRRKRAELPTESIVTIEYSPRRDGDPDPGEIVWAWVPYEEDPTQGKDRPVAIIGRRGPNLVGVPLTTRRNSREAQVNMGTGGWDPKRRTSYARVWRTCDIDPDRTRREGAVLDVQRFGALVGAVDKYYDVRLPDDGGADQYDY